MMALLYLYIKQDGGFYVSRMPVIPGFKARGAFDTAGDLIQAVLDIRGLTGIKWVESRCNGIVICCDPDDRTIFVEGIVTSDDRANVFARFGLK